MSSTLRDHQCPRTARLLHAKALPGNSHDATRSGHHRRRCMSAIEAKPDITLAELAEMLKAERGASFAPSSIWRFLDRHGETFKKKRARSRAG